MSVARDVKNKIFAPPRINAPFFLGGVVEPVVVVAGFCLVGAAPDGVVPLANRTCFVVA